MTQFLHHRGLIMQMARRDIVTRYRTSFLGVLWVLLQPLLMLVLYSFVFGHIMQARWPHPQSGVEIPGLYSLMLFGGLLLHGVLAETLTRAPQLIISQPNFVKKIVFPVHVLPVVMLAVALFHLTIGLIIWLAAGWLVLGTLHWQLVLLPLVLLPFLLICLGVGWLLAALGVYLRDVGHIMGLVATVLLFLSPVLYPPALLPEWALPVLLLNPLTWPVETLRALLVSGTFPALLPLLIYAAVSVVVAYTGFRFFQKARGGFADVL